MNHGGIEALLIQDLMHNLMMQKLRHLTGWTQNAKNPLAPGQSACSDTAGH
jgi:hypothetical protein